MQIHILRFGVFAFVTGLALLAFAGWAQADPPARVARLGYTAGPVSFSPAGENDWVQATVNRPLTNGDRLWTDAGGRAEIQLGAAMVRMSDSTSVSVLNIDDRIAQLQLAEGTLSVYLRRLEPNQVFEIDTPNLAFRLRQPGQYRIVVDPGADTTDIMVRKGRGEVYGEGAAYTVDARQPYRFKGTGLRDYQYLDGARPDAFDRWASNRDRRYDNSSSARYVSRDVVGYHDLDANGRWRVEPGYGNVWVPNRVAADWAPYRDGHWAWVDPWGWTWIDNAPWGYAVSHYGRWANLGGAWAWVPGPVRAPAYYAPAQVAFVGGHDFRLTIPSGDVGGVAWFPLAPREVYRPSYSVSRGYFQNVNRGNTVINNTVINNTYNTSNVRNLVYVNQQVPGAVIAVPATVFAQSQPVFRAAVRVSPQVLASAPVTGTASVVPTERSVRGAAGATGKPPQPVFERPVVARTAPPAAHAGFAAQQQQLAASPGRPLDDAARKELKPAAAAGVPVVKVLAAPATPAASTTPGGAIAQPAVPALAAVPPVVLSASSARPTASAARPPEQPASSDQRARREQRAQPVTPPPAMSQGAAPATAQRAVEPRPTPAPVVPSAAAMPATPPTAAAPTRVVVSAAPAAVPKLPPPVRAPEPQAAAPQVVPSATVVQARPQPATPPTSASPAQVVISPAPAAPAQPAAKPETAAAAKPAEPRPPVSVPKLPPPVRAAEPQAVAPQVAPSATVMQARPRPATPPMSAPPARVVTGAPPAAAAQQPAKPESAPVARQVQARPSADVAKPAPAPPPAPPSQTQSSPRMEPNSQRPGPAASQVRHTESETDAPRRAGENRKP